MSASERTLVVHTESPEQTRAVGVALGRTLADQVALSLEGPLGSGKTVLVQGICEGLGVTEPVTSPTYTLQNEYAAEDGRRVVHVDCFRLRGPSELEDLAVFEGDGDDAVVLVEWGDRVLEALPADVIRIRLTPEAETERRIGIDVPPGVSLSLESGREP